MENNGIDSEEKGLYKAMLGDDLPEMTVGLSGAKYIKTG